MTDDKLFKKALIASSLLHLGIIILFWFGPLSFFQRLPSEQNNISFEVAFVSDINNIKPQQAKIKKAQKQESSQVLKKTVENKITAPPQNIPANPVKQPIEEPKKTETTPQKEEAVKIQDKKPAPTPPKISPKTEATKKPAVQKPPVQPQSDPLDSILKNLEESSGDNNSKKIHKNAEQAEEDMKFFNSDNYNDNMVISVTEKNLIKNAIERNWNKPTSLPINNGIKVLFKIEFERNGAIKTSSHLKTICNYSDDICKIAIESVSRAINSTKIIKGLPPERYDLWKVMELHFDLELI